MNKRTGYLFLLITSVLFIYSISQKTDYAPDDTYIYLQYARNLASGNGFAFNPGEPSYGVTSPVWVFLLTIPYFLKLNPIWFAKILDIFFLLLACLTFYKLSVKFNGAKKEFFSLSALSVFIANVWLMRWSFTGMETNLAVLLTLLSFYFYYTTKYTYLYLTLVFLQLTRPESFLLTGIFTGILLYRTFREKNTESKNVIPGFILYALIIGAFCIYAKITFGTFIPNTATGKATLIFSLTVLFNQLKQICTTLAPASIIEVIISIIFFISIIKSKQLKRYRSILLWITGLIVLYIVTDADIISRYLLIIIPFFTILSFKFLSGHKRSYTVAAVIIILIQSQYIFYQYVIPHTDNFSYGVETCFKPIGEWLKNNTDKNSKILVNDVGAIGYYSERYIYDAAALVNRDINLNKKIMNIPPHERGYIFNLLPYVNADYVIERSKTDPYGSTVFTPQYKMEFLFAEEFPGLGISDNTSTYYKVYKVVK